MLDQLLLTCKRVIPDGVVPETALVPDPDSPSEACPTFPGELGVEEVSTTINKPATTKAAFRRGTSKKFQLLEESLNLTDLPSDDLTARIDSRAPWRPDQRFSEGLPQLMQDAPNVHYAASLRILEIVKDNTTGDPFPSTCKVHKSYHFGLGNELQMKALTLDSTFVIGYSVMGIYIARLLAPQVSTTSSGAGDLPTIFDTNVAQLLFGKPGPGLQDPMVRP